MEQIINELKDKLGNNKVLVCVSCGIDSMVLLDLVMKSIPNNNIYIAHVNHKVRIQSDIEEDFIKDFAEKNKLHLDIMHLDKIDNNFEEEARNKRYQFFLDIAKKNHIRYILTAHHALDNLETIIMRFLRSSNLKAYGGIEKETPFHDCILYRPLLRVDKEDIITYAKSNNIKYFNDSTNDTNDYMRNRIRHNIIPYLKEENPNLINAINNYSTTLISAASYLLDEVHKFINNNFIINDDIIIPINTLSSKNLFFQKQALFEALKPFELSNNTIDEMLKNIHNDKKKIIYKINNDLSFIKEYNNIIITKKDLTPLSFNLIIDKDGVYNLPNNKTLTINKNICTLTTNKEKICYNIDSLPITIRTRQINDTLKRKKNDKVTNNITYYTQTLSNYLTNKKVPTLIRNNLLLMINSNNEIIYLISDIKLNI